MATLRADCAGATSADSIPQVGSSQSNSVSQHASADLKHASTSGSTHESSSFTGSVLTPSTLPRTSRIASIPQSLQHKVVKNNTTHAQQSSTKAVVTRSMVYFHGLPDVPRKQLISKTSSTNSQMGQQPNVHKRGTLSHPTSSSSQQSPTNAIVTRPMFQLHGLPSSTRI